MMDAPPEQIETIEQEMAEELAACGLDRSGLTVSWEAGLQYVLVDIAASAGVQPEMFPCINAALRGGGRAIFQNVETRVAYDEWAFEKARPNLLAYLETELAKRGLLERFPARIAGQSAPSYARELELLCGFEAGAAIEVEGRHWKIIMEGGAFFESEGIERARCLLSAMHYANLNGDADIKFGFVGNEKIPADQSP